MRVHTRSPPSDPEVLGPCAGWPGQLLRPSDNSQEVKNPFDLRITRSLDPVVDQEDLVQQEGRQRHRPVVAQPGMPETFVQLEHLLEPPEERLDRPAASPVQRPPELRLVEPPPLRPVLAAPPPPVRLPPDPLPAAVEERLGFFRVSRSRKRSPGSLARVGPTHLGRCDRSAPRQIIEGGGNKRPRPEAVVLGWSSRGGHLREVAPAGGLEFGRFRPSPMHRQRLLR